MYAGFTVWSVSLVHETVLMWVRGRRFQRYLCKNMNFLPYSDSSKLNTAPYTLLLPLLCIPKLSQIQSRYGMKVCRQSKWWLFLQQCGALVWSRLLRSGTFPWLFRESSLLLVTSVSLKEVLPNVTSVITRNFTVKLLSSAQQKNKVQRTGPFSEACGRNDNVL